MKYIIAALFLCLTTNVVTAQYRSPVQIRVTINQPTRYNPTYPPNYYGRQLDYQNRILTQQQFQQQRILNNFQYNYYYNNPYFQYYVDPITGQVFRYPY